MDQIFINTYVEIALATLDEYIKKDIMTRTNLEIAKKLAESLNIENAELKAKVVELEEKINKKKSKEVNTSF